MQFDFQQNFFQMFGLPECFKLDGTVLEQNFLTLQSQVHPDKFAHQPESERRLSLQWATRVNEAYQTLRKPIDRARYLLKLRGVDTQEETNTAMPTAFLMQQMEWREAIDEARQAGSLDELDALEARVQHEAKALHQQLEASLDQAHDYPAAAGVVRKLKFFEKLSEEVASAYDELDH